MAEDRKQVFFENLIIDEEDKVRAERFLTSKGVEKHIILKEKLFNWIEGDKIEYSMIASSYRYDKRIRLILFKYISYLEELYRSILLDRYRFNVEECVWIRDIQLQLDKYANDLNDALEHVDFSSLLIQIQKLPDQIKDKCGLPQRRTLENCKALKGLRNAVMHNKFLLLYRGYDVCYVEGVDANKSASFKANLLNLIQFLPKEVGGKCMREINQCKEDDGEQNKTKWNLPEMLVVDLAID